MVQKVFRPWGLEMRMPAAKLTPFTLEIPCAQLICTGDFLKKALLVFMVAGDAIELHFAIQGHTGQSHFSGYLGDIASMDR